MPIAQIKRWHLSPPPYKKKSHAENVLLYPQYGGLPVLLSPPPVVVLEGESWEGVDWLLVLQLQQPGGQVTASGQGVMARGRRKAPQSKWSFWILQLDKLYPSK